MSTSREQLMVDYTDQLSKAVQQYRRVRTRQAKEQGGATGKKDAGNCSAVTGGKHLVTDSLRY